MNEFLAFRIKYDTSITSDLRSRVRGSHSPRTEADVVVLNEKVFSVKPDLC